MTNWKGHKLAVKAISRLKVKNFKLVFIGDMQGRVKYKNELINLATTLMLRIKLFL